MSNTVRRMACHFLPSRIDPRASLIHWNAGTKNYQTIRLTIVTLEQIWCSCHYPRSTKLIMSPDEGVRGYKQPCEAAHIVLWKIVDCPCQTPHNGVSTTLEIPILVQITFWNFSFAALFEPSPRDQSRVLENGSM